MNEFPRPEQLNNNQRSKAERVSEVIHALTDHLRYTNPSEHFVKPIEKNEPIFEPSQSFQHDIIDDKEGFDSNGNFHRTIPHKDKKGNIDESHPGYEINVLMPEHRISPGSMGEYITDTIIERTNQSQLRNTGGRWDDMGRYDVV